MAAATTVDIARMRGAPNAENPPGLLERYLAFLVGLQDPAPAEDAGKPQLGPHVLLAWGQDLRVGRSTPQVALLVECGAGTVVRRRTRRMVEGLLKFMQVLEPTPLDTVPTIVRSRHLGVTIYSVSLSAYAEKSGLALMSVARDASPSWTIWNGWLILTASRDHLERILDAQYGLIPGLATVDDVRELRLSRSGRFAVSIVQPDLATKVLDGWLADRDEGGASFLDASWWGGQVEATTAGRRIDPAGAVRELAGLGRTLEFLSYAVDVSDPYRFSARISLRFRTPRVSKAKAE